MCSSDLNYEDHLKAFADRAFPFATKNALNSAAFKARELWQRDINVKMITRNKFTERSIQVEQSRTLTVSRQSATVGSTAPYMDEQEFGGTKRKTGQEGVALPTSYSAGQDGQQPRTKLPRKPNNIRNIKLQRRGRKAKSRKHAIVIKMQDAISTGKRLIFLDLGRKKGIFRVIGGSRNFKRGIPRGAKLRMVYDMSEQSVTIPRNPTLQPAVDRTSILMPDLYIKALKFQLQRQGLFK